MKKKILLLLFLAFFIIDKAYNKENKEIFKKDSTNKTNLQPIILKYSKVTEDLIEVYEYINFYKAILDTMNTWNLNFKETKIKLKKYIDNMSKQKKCRFGYLDWKISNIYPEFFSEFKIINSRHYKHLNMSFYNKKELSKYSIYHKREKILPDILDIRLFFWNSLIKICPEIDIKALYNSYFYMWSVVKFTEIKEISVDHHLGLNALITQAQIVDSPFEKLKGKKIKLIIIMFGSQRKYSLNKLYLINYSYSFYQRPLNKTYKKPYIGFSSQVKRVYELENDKIVFKKPEAYFSDNWHPLKDLKIDSKKELFYKIKKILEILKESERE